MIKFLPLVIATVLVTLITSGLVGYYIFSEAESSEQSRSGCQFGALISLVVEAGGGFKDFDESKNWFTYYDLSPIEKKCGSGLVFSSSFVLDSSGSEVVVRPLQNKKILVRRKKGPVEGFFSLSYNSVYLKSDPNNTLVIERVE